ncbi:MAG: nucleotide exchange factor GrpE [Cyanobacteriota bacterium]|jgi:molecular chaperone GrpE (heat shock protein)
MTNNSANPIQSNSSAQDNDTLATDQDQQNPDNPIEVGSNDPNSTETSTGLENLLENSEQPNTEPANLETNTEQPLHNIPKIKDLSALVTLAWQQEKESQESDIQELEQYYEQACQWQQKGQEIFNELPLFLEDTKAILTNSQELKLSLPQELQAKIQGRNEGLEIIGRMVERLREQAQEITETVVRESIDHLIITEQELSQLIVQEVDEASAKKVLDSQLKLRGNERWHLVGKMRETAQNRRKRFLQFLEKKMLPIIDALDSGKQFSEPLIQSMEKEVPEQAEPEQAENLQLWFDTYAQLQEKILSLLNKFGVYRMQVEKGNPIDYDRHEPIDIEPDETLTTEDIKEVSRAGYEYELASDSRIVLRCAEVIVVKN